MAKFDTQKFPLLLRRGQIGNFITQNRVVLTAHTYAMCNDKGEPTDLYYDYVMSRAKGGVGTIILGETLVDTIDTGNSGTFGAGVSTKETEAFYMKLVRSAPNTLFIEQLYHPGGQVWSEDHCVSASAPSRVPHPVSFTIPRQLTIKEIYQIKEAFVSAAERALSSGVGLELKCDQGKLFHQFLSKKFNRRADQYGGSIRNRIRVVEEILRSIRNLGYHSLPVGIRLAGTAEMSPDRFQPDIDISETKKIIEYLQKHELIDYVSISGATNSEIIGYVKNHGDDSIPDCTFEADSESIKEVSTIPLILAGRILSAQSAEKLLFDNKCDFIGMARALIADPNFVNKIKNGRVKEIYSCISCNQSCVGNTWAGLPVDCVTNPRARYSKRSPFLGSSRKKIIVVGGGLAGLEFSINAGNQGHDIQIWEGSNELGGQVNLSSKLPFRARYKNLISDRIHAMKMCTNIEVNLNRPAMVGDQQLLDADRILVATGSIPAFSDDLSDADEIRKIVFFSEVVAFAPEVISSANWLVFDTDWKLAGLQCAEWLSLRGANVHVVTPFAAPASGSDLVSMASTLGRLRKLGCEVSTWKNIEVSRSRELVLRDLLTGDVSLLTSYKYILFSGTQKPVGADLVDWFLRNGKDVKCVGDANFPTGMFGAVRSAREAALKKKV